MADLFLSYSSKDAETAHKIAQELERRGSSIYYHRPEPLETDELHKLDQEMDQASWIIILWSANALQDGRITYEAMHAREKNNLLSVQIEPNSIPAEYNNAHSTDHVNFQNQLTGIIKQALSPATAESVAPAQTQTAQNDSQPAEQQAEKTSPNNEASAKTQTADLSNVTATVKPVQTDAAPSPEQVQQTSSPQAVKEAPQQNATPQQTQAEISPRQNLQQKLAEKTQLSQTATTIPPALNKVGQPPQQKQPQQATQQTPQKRELPPLPTSNKQATLASAPQNPQQTTPPQKMAAAAMPAKTNKFIPVALMSAGTLLLGTVGAGYWYLANNTPASAVVQTKTSAIIKRDLSPVKVAVNTIHKPASPSENSASQSNENAAATQETKSNTVSAEDDPLLSSILQKIPTSENTAPKPAVAKEKPIPKAAVADASKDVASNMVIKASAQRGEKSISQCSGCHSFNKNGLNKTGPNLYGVINQLIGSERKFDYSDTLRSMGAIGETWNSDQLDCYLKDPSVCMPGTKMGFNGIKSQTKRADIIAYLKTLQN